LKFQIEIIDIDFSTSVDKIYTLSIDDLFKVSNEHKDDANELFKSSLPLTAFYRYQKAIRYLIIAQQLAKTVHEHEKHEDVEVDFGDKKRILELKALLYLNIAACQLKYPNNSENVIKNCTKCLEIDDNNVKAFYRRALAYAELNELDKGIEDLKHALKIEANNKVVEVKLRDLEEIKKKNNEQMSNNLRKMFS
jgi:tetratricopeptide (TPR) repeat protein